MRGWLLTGCLVLSGCAKLPKLGELSDYLPKVSFKTMDVKDVTFRGATTIFIMEVDNPHPVGLDLPSVNWDLDLAGADFLDGTKDTPLRVEPTAVKPVRVPVDLRWKNVLGLLQNAKGQDAVPYVFGGDVKVDTPVGALKVPFRREGELPVLHMPRVQLTGLRVAKLDVLKNTATLELDMDLSSDHGQAIGVEDFAYGIELAGTKVANGKAAISSLEGQTTATLPMNLKLLELGSTVVRAITEKSRLDVTLDADASFDTPLGSVPLAIRETQTLKLK